LSTTTDGTASLTAVEGQLALSLTPDSTGGIRLVGEAVDVVGAGNRLQFGFVVEEASLVEVSRALESLLAAFPVIAGPDA
jgi:hypothetical protein